MDVLQLWWLMLKQSEAILQLCQTFPHRQVDQSSALQSHVLTRSFLRRETADPTAATKGKRWTSAGSQICQVITKLCIKHWHKHRCAHTNLACSMCCTSTHTHAHTVFFSFHYNLCFGWRPYRMLTLVVLTLVVGELLSKPCWRGVK